jgi:hypothetical protein
MKVVLIRDNGDSEFSDYRDVAILMEPLGELPEYQYRALIGSRNGVISEIAENPEKGTTYTIYDVNLSVRNQMLIIDWINSQIGKPISSVKFWQKPFKFLSWRRTSAVVQERRKKRGVWTAAEFALVAFQKGEHDLIMRCRPYQMDPELLSRSPRLYLKGRLEAK